MNNDNDNTSTTTNTSNDRYDTAHPREVPGRY